jgi:N-acetylmuramoyl-L-alanine amidase
MAFLLLLSATFCQVANAEIKQPEMITRATWEAKPANIKNMTPQPIDKKKKKIVYKGIVIHHTEIEQTNDKWVAKSTAQKMRDIQDQHQHRQTDGKFWGDFAYHYFIDVNGDIAMGHDIKYRGDSGTKYDMNGLLLVVLQGDFDKDQPTDKQKASLDDLIAWLAAKHNVAPEGITAHKDHTDTTCPGQNLYSYMGELKKKTAAALKNR